MNSVLKLTNVSKEFERKTVVDNISLEVEKGEILGILGPNGAGKTTAIRCMMGIIYPDSGIIEYAIPGGRNGIPYSSIGYLPEERGLYKNVKVMDVLLYLSNLKGYPQDKARSRALDYLEVFGLKGYDGAKVQELSKGMAQKVQFIASILHEPELLVLDEPFSGLDPVSQDYIIKGIRGLAESGTTILLSSHQMNRVEQLCDRIFLINKGKKVLYGPVQEIKEQFGHFKCTVIGDNDKSLFEGSHLVESVEQMGNNMTVHIKSGYTPNDFLNEFSSKVKINELNISRISLHEIFVKVATGGVR
ncbi:MAG: ATP-binding cassette domain-containing protein [Clostridia bacterium]|nr:ATP-binding cassette domain-containing protein [Clostridia bacterium]